MAFLLNAARCDPSTTQGGISRFHFHVGVNHLDSLDSKGSIFRHTAQGDTPPLPAWARPCSGLPQARFGQQVLSEDPSVHA